ncbi:hypothetical protein [Nonomuraea sp. NPDC049784]|uniref:hypothetical protein n=1 Tax=Nonomuraea sp. NPDC049784 TaxID=3154361 RepID=UPI0033C41D0A
MTYTIDTDAFGQVYVVPREFAYQSSRLSCAVHLTRKLWNLLIDNADIGDDLARHVRIHHLLWEAAQVINQAAENGANPIDMRVARQRTNGQLLEANLRIWPQEDPWRPLTIELAEVVPVDHHESGADT